MKTFMLAAVLAIGGVSAANAAEPAGDYPLCSKTITDECINPSQAPRAIAHTAHHARHEASRLQRKAAAQGN